jgi:hypothetical protein
MSLCLPKDSFTCQANWQGSRVEAANGFSLTRLFHLPDKLAGVIQFTTLNSYKSAKLEIPLCTMVRVAVVFALPPF